MHELTMESIGIVKSPITEGVDENWGSVVSEIRVKEEYAEGLKGLEAFSHALIIFYMHVSSFKPGDDLVRRPRGLTNMPNIGIFAQRAKHRPNPIGVTAVEILNVERSVLHVKGLDAIDGTPVIDVKPYFPVFDRVDCATVPEWVDILMQGYF